MGPVLSVEQAAYLAGAIDGEGSLTLVPTGTTYNARLQITNTNLAWLEELRDWVGGHITQSQSRGNKRACYALILATTPALAALDAVQPYLRLKAEHALVFRRFAKLRLQRAAQPRGVRSDPAIVAAMEALRQEIKRLNGRGVNAPFNPGRPRTFKTCTLTGCPRKHYGAGYCKQHYKKYVERGGSKWHERICKRCGKLFVAKRNDAEHCSKRCTDLTYYETHRDRILRRVAERRATPS